MRKSEIPSAPGSHLLCPNEKDLKIDNKKQALYCLAIDMLSYLMKHSRPDIANAVREHLRMMDGATPKHYKTLLQLIKYVIDTKNHTLKLKFTRDNGNIFNIQDFSDSDYAGNKDDRNCRLNCITIEF